MPGRRKVRDRGDAQDAETVLLLCSRNDRQIEKWRLIVLKYWTPEYHPNPLQDKINAMSISTLKGLSQMVRQMTNKLSMKTWCKIHFLPYPRTVKQGSITPPGHIYLVTPAYHIISRDTIMQNGCFLDCYRIQRKQQWFLNTTDIPVKAWRFSLLK